MFLYHKYTMFKTIKCNYILLWLFLLIPLFLSLNLCKTYIVIKYDWKFKLLICTYIMGAIMIYLKKPEQKKKKYKSYNNLIITSDYKEFMKATKKREELEYFKYMNDKDIKKDESDDDTFMDIYGVK